MFQEGGRDKMLGDTVGIDGFERFGGEVGIRIRKVSVGGAVKNDDMGEEVICEGMGGIVRFGVGLDVGAVTGGPSTSFDA